MHLHLCSSSSFIALRLKNLRPYICNGRESIHSTKRFGMMSLARAAETLFVAAAALKSDLREKERLEAELREGMGLLIKKLVRVCHGAPTAFLRTRLRPPRCPLPLKASLEKRLAPMIVDMAGTFELAAAVSGAIRPLATCEVKGSAAVFLGLSSLERRRFAHLSPGDLDVALCGVNGAGDVLRCAHEVCSAVRPLLDPHRVMSALAAFRCRFDFARARVADQTVSWAPRDLEGLPLLAWLHPRAIVGSRGEEVWLGRVGLSVRRGPFPLLLPFVDVVAEARPPTRSARRPEEGTNVIEGVTFHSSEYCANVHLRMLFDETGSQPWKTKSPQARLQRCALLCCKLWVGDPRVISETVLWIDRAVDEEVRFAASARGRLQYLLRKRRCIAPLNIRGVPAWKESPLRALVAGLTSMIRRFQREHGMPKADEEGFFETLFLTSSTLREVGQLEG